MHFESDTELIMPQKSPSTNPVTYSYITSQGPELCKKKLLKFRHFDIITVAKRSQRRNFRMEHKRHDPSGRLERTVIL